MVKLRRSYEQILAEDIKRSGLTREEVEGLYREFCDLAEMLEGATEKEKEWIKQDFERIKRKLKK